MKALLLALALLVAGPATAQQVVVGSKKFTENVILGEIATALAQANGAVASHRRELGGSRVLWEALKAGDIDLYPEYTGTLLEETLAADRLGGIVALRRRLAELGIGMTPPLGFSDGYALGMRRQTAHAMRIDRISDLNSQPGLRFGLSNEFMDRGDGWPALKTAYGLIHTDVRGIDHDLAYRALISGDIDVIDLYTTDAEIAYYDLAALADDRGHFPRYDAVYLFRLDLADREPAVVTAVAGLAGSIDESAMTAMNKAVKLDHRPEAAIAAAFLTARGVAATAANETWGDRLIANTAAHLALVSASLAAAILIAVPLGIVAARQRRLGRAILAVAGVAQTIPALALFVALIPIFGIGAKPAIAALFLYSLLPIVRNTHAGITGIDRRLVDSADAMGLPAGARLRLIELPLALPTILTGVKTAAVINVGLATLGAIIGAGGYGQPILTGIRLADTGLILEGAIPAAVLALAVEHAFERLERTMVPRGLKA